MWLPASIVTVVGTSEIPFCTFFSVPFLSLCFQFTHRYARSIQAYNLHTAGIITEADFKAADDPLRQALRLILKVYDNLHKLPVELQKKTLEEKFYVVAVLFDNVQDALKTILGPHLKVRG